MTPSTWTPELTSRAEEIWHDYASQHDLSHRRGEVAGIDPVSGRVWIGESGVEVAEQVAADGVERPVYLVRIGSTAYVRKGCR